MNDHPTQARAITMAAVSSSVAGLISSGHHVYGALIYDTPWRIVVSLWIPGFVVLLLAALYAVRKHPGGLIGRASFWFVLLGGAVFQSGFTLFECADSHVLKNALFFAGVPQSTLLWLFPPPAYHLPDNMLFELTGLIQLAGFWAAWWAWRVFKTRPKP